MIDPKERVRKRLVHITKACREIKGYVAGLSREEFPEDASAGFGCDDVWYEEILAREITLMGVGYVKFRLASVS